MKKLVVVIILVGLIKLTNAQINKEECMNKINNIAKNAGNKTECLIDIANYTRKASFNYNYLLDLAEKYSQYNMDNQAARALAKAMSECSFNNELFEEMTTLAILLQKPDKDYFDLLEKVKVASHKNDAMDVKRKILEMKSSAPYKSLEEIPVK